MSDFDIRELARIIDRAEPCVCKPPRTNAAEDAIAYLSSCEAVEAGPDRGEVDVWEEMVVHRIAHWDTLRAQLVATRAQLAELEQCRAMFETHTDDYHREMGVVRAERDAALVEVERLRTTNVDVTTRYHETLNQLDCAEQDRDHAREQLKAAGIACTCGGVACPVCGDEEARLVP